MATIRATVNEHGFYSLDVKFDIVGTDSAFDMVKNLVSQIIKDYNPESDFWIAAIQEAVKDGTHWHYWNDKIVSLYYEKDGHN